MEKEYLYQKFLGAYLGQAAKMLLSTLTLQLRQAGYEITNEHWIILVHLWRQDGLNQQYLVESTGFNKTSITRALDSLEKQSFVIRVPDQADRRNKLIYLTHKGKAMEQTLVPHVETVHKVATANINPEELATCKRVLQTLYQNLSQDL